MSAALQPDIWVEVIEADPSYGLVLGAFHYVTAVFDDCGGCTVHGERCPGGSIGAELRGLEKHSGEVACAACLRPVDRRTTELFRSLLTPAPEVALEDA